MRTIKLFLILIIILSISNTSAGCAKHTLDEISTNETQNLTEQKKADDLKIEFEEWTNYLDSYNKKIYPLENDLYDLSEKRVSAANSDDNKKAISYALVEFDKCEELIEALHSLYVPNVAKDYHDYLTNSSIKYKHFLSYIIEWSDKFEDGITGITDFDSTKAQSLLDEHKHFRALTDQEYERINMQFKKRFEDLGFFDLDNE